jgi:hypothetical protein
MAINSIVGIRESALKISYLRDLLRDHIHALMLITIDVSETWGSVFGTLFQSLAISLYAFLFSSVEYLIADDFDIIEALATGLAFFFGILIYSIAMGFVDKLLLPAHRVQNPLAFSYATTLSMAHLPIVFAPWIKHDRFWSGAFLLVQFMVSGFYIHVCLTRGYRFESTKSSCIFVLVRCLSMFLFLFFFMGIMIHSTIM